MDKEEIRYCTLWIPCVAHNELTILSGKDTLQYPSQKSVNNYNPLYRSKNGVYYDITTFAERISDGTESEDAKYRITIDVKANILDKRKSTAEFNEVFSFKVELTSIEYRHCGLIQFSYGLSNRDHQRFDDIKDTVYHQIKGHFHNHFHHNETESLLKGYYCYKRVNLKENDNSVLEYYLKQIHSLLSDQIEQIHYEYIFLEVDGLNSINDLKEARRIFYANCENVLGQFVFFRSLLNSKRNLSCRVRPLTPNPKEELRRLAFNISNLVDALRTIYRKSQSAFYLHNIHETVDIQNAIKQITESSVALGRLNHQISGDIKDIVAANKEVAISNENLIREIKSSMEKSDEIAKLSKNLGIWSLILGIGGFVFGGISVWQGCTNQASTATTEAGLNPSVVDSIDNQSKNQKPLYKEGNRGS